MLSLRGTATVGAIVLVTLLGALAWTVGLGALGWVVGLGCGVGLIAAVRRGLAQAGVDDLGPADLVTLTRATLTCAVAALVADSIVREPAVTALVGIAVVALVLDGVDGWVARRTRTATTFGTRFDGEVDAFLMLVLSVYVAGLVGWWVLAIGAARYVFALAGWWLPWMRRELPFRYWRKVATAVQGIVLAFAAADIAPLWISGAALLAALALLAESFGRDVLWLWRRRAADIAEPPEPVPVGVAAAQVDEVPDTPPDEGARPSKRRHRRRTAVATVTNTMAVLLVWFALVAPNHADRLTPSAFLHLPVEALVVAALALVLPTAARWAMAVVVGLVLGLLAVVKILDMGFFLALDRPFDPVGDPGYLEPAVGVLRDSIGPAGTTLVVTALALVLLGLLIGMPLSVARLTGIVARHRAQSLRAVAALAVAWITFAAFGLQFGQGEPIASVKAGSLAVGEVRAFTAGVEDEEQFDAAAAVDEFSEARRGKLLDGLRGKDVVITFVESYGRVALEGPSSAKVRTLLDNGTRRLGASGYSARSAYLTSSTFGGLSWLAHATLQSGLWVDNERRHDRLLSSSRTTLTSAFGEAGWRTVAVMPSNPGKWPEGKAFYGFDKIYDRTDIKYRGPKFGWSAMPDQFVLAAFQRRELSRRRPVMAEISLSSSHIPWAPLPRMVPWNRLGDGSVYERIHSQGRSAQELWRDTDDVKAAYSRSIRYSLRALIAFVEKYGDRNLVLIVLGDHQPTTLVSGNGASHDVPITIIAKDPAVLDRISEWGWKAGLRPSPETPVWRMDAFRDRWIAAFSPESLSTSTRPASPPRSP